MATNIENAMRSLAEVMLTHSFRNHFPNARILTTPSEIKEARENIPQSLLPFMRVEHPQWPDIYALDLNDSPHNRVVVWSDHAIVMDWNSFDDFFDWLSKVAGQKTSHEKGMMMEARISVVTLGVSDLKRSFHFYREGLGFPTKMTPEGGIVIFATSGARLSLYPNEKLAEDVGPKVSQIENKNERFPGFTFGHCVRKKEEVAAILSQAEKSGGRIVKEAQDTFWGGYSGYFSDPDGYLWEVAYSDQWKFNADGSVIVGE